MATARAASADRASLSSPTRGPKVTDTIIEALRQDIVTGRLERGARLPNERDLAAHFGVSQPTIREAVRALDAMGLVDVRHGSGAYVRGDGTYMLAAALQTMLQIERVTIIEALDVRETLGLESVRRAATAATDEELDQLDALLDTVGRVEELATVDAIIEAISEFQTAVSAAAHNPLMLALEGFLVNLLLKLQIRVLRERGVAFWRERSSAFQPDRVAIVAALRKRNGPRAEKAMKAYLEHQREEFLRDPDFSKMRLSDENSMRAVAEIVTAARIA
jgi:GntR family transcriptional repressor for pyruvate dehydrogenase complex